MLVPSPIRIRPSRPSLGKTCNQVPLPTKTPRPIEIRCSLSNRTRQLEDPVRPEGLECRRDCEREALVSSS